MKKLPKWIMELALKAVKFAIKNGQVTYNPDTKDFTVAVKKSIKF